MNSEAIELEGMAETEVAKSYASKRAHEQRLERIRALQNIALKEGVELYSKDQDYLMALMAQQEAYAMVTGHNDE